MMDIVGCVNVKEKGSMTPVLLMLKRRAAGHQPDLY